MNITQTFYDNLSSHYDKLFQDWQAEVFEQALILDRIFKNNGFDKSIRILDCACGIGTQAIGLANLGYNVTASDISESEIAEAKNRALKNNVNIHFDNADFRALDDVFAEKFDVVIVMDNALPHMLTKEDLAKAVESIIGQLKDGGAFVASIRDYDELIKSKPPYSPPYIHKTQNGQRVSFQTWDWEEDRYNLTQYIIEDETTLNVSKFRCEYRATLRAELTELFELNGCSEISWKFPEETGFYQPIVIAKK